MTSRRPGHGGSAAHALDARGLRWLGSLLRSMRLTLKGRRVHVVRRRRGVLTYRYPGGIVTVRGMAGPDQLHAETTDAFLWGYKPGTGDVVVDCGAGVGTELLTFCRLVGPTGRVVAVEAHPRSYAKLQLFVELNDLSNVVTVQAAVCDSIGSVTISDLRNEQANTIVAVRGPGLEVPADTLEAILGRAGVDRVGLLKMNIEGAEERALGAFAQSGGLDRVSNAVIACHDFAGGERRTLDVVRAVLEGAGFNVRMRDDPRAWIANYVYASRPSARRRSQHDAAAVRVA